MSIKLACESCEWWGEYAPADTPLFCPECRGEVSVADGFTDIDPEDKKSNEI